MDQVLLTRLDRLPKRLTVLNVSYEKIDNAGLTYLDNYVEKRGWKLKTLLVSSNLLTEVVDFTSLPDLESLYLSGNQLQTLPDFSHSLG